MPTRSVAALAVTAWLAACGSGNGGTASDDAAAGPREVVTRYLAAYTRGDGATACELLSEKARRATGGADCASTLSQVAKLGHAPPSEAREVKVNGNRARAIIAYEKDGQRWRSVITLVREGGEWRVDTSGTDARVAKPGER